MLAFVKCFLLLMALAGLVHAKAGAAEDDKAPANLESAIRSALESRHFPGGQVQELLLADPESHGSKAFYIAEFAVRRAGRIIRCEDWRFSVQRVADGWAILKTERGRCND